MVNKIHIASDHNKYVIFILVRIMEDITVSDKYEIKDLCPFQFSRHNKSKFLHIEYVLLQKQRTEYLMHCFPRQVR